MAEVKIVDVRAVKGDSAHKELVCSECGESGSIFVRTTCLVDFDADYYDKGMDVGIGFSKETANNIEVWGDESQVICSNCGAHLDRPDAAGKPMRLIQDV